MTGYLAQLVLVLPLLSGTGMAAKYYADHEYITVSSQLQSEMRLLKREIRSLEYDVAEGVATEKQIWDLDHLRHLLDELEAQYLSNM